MVIPAGFFYRGVSLASIVGYHSLSWGVASTTSITTSNYCQKSRAFDCPSAALAQYVTGPRRPSPTLAGW